MAAQYDEEFKEYSKYCQSLGRVASHEGFDLLEWLHSKAREDWLAGMAFCRPLRSLQREAEYDPAKGFAGAKADCAAKGLIDRMDKDIVAALVDAPGLLELDRTKKYGCLGGHTWYSDILQKCCPVCGRWPSHEVHGNGVEQKDAPNFSLQPGALNTIGPDGTPTPLPKKLADMTDAERKAVPLLTGVIDYFLPALVEIAMVSKAGNDQHNPGEPLHWAKGKSTDHGNTAMRHLAQHGTRDKDGMRHTAKAAWRLLAMLTIEVEAEQHGMTYAGYTKFLEEQK